MINFSIKLSKNEEYVATNCVSVYLRCIEMRLPSELRPNPTVGAYSVPQPLRRCHCP